MSIRLIKKKCLLEIWNKYNLKIRDGINERKISLNSF